MPRKYTSMPDDIFVLTGATTIYSMISSIEEKLVAAGYKGPLLADFDNTIYKAKGMVDKEATEAKQAEKDAEREEENKKRKEKGEAPLGKAPKVSPVYKSSDLDLNNKGEELESTGKGCVMVENNHFSNSKEYTKKSDKEFHKYLETFEKYLDMLIANTPEEEFKEESVMLRFHKANVRTVRTFGSRVVFSNELGFATSIRGFDGDLPTIKEPGVPGSGVSRELWKQVYKNYAYSDAVEAATNLMNTACDIEENKEKNNYIDQLQYREKYRKAVKDFLGSCEALGNGPEAVEKIAKQMIRDNVIANLKKADGKDKDIDYHAILKRVEEQEKNGQEPSPDDSAIAKIINEAVDKEYDPSKYDYCNTRYKNELSAMGYTTNEKDFTGNRGIQLMKYEMEAQLNAIDMGWPLDELVNIERLTTFFRRGIAPKTNNFTPEQKETIKKAKEFYEEKIKDKPYPATEAERKALYEEFYQVATNLKEASKRELINVEDDESFDLQWDEFTDGVKKAMEKPLTFDQKLVLKHIQQDAEPEITAESMAEIKEGIGKDRFGHSNSTEYKALKNAIGKFDAAFKANNNGFAVTYKRDISPENLKILEELKASAEKYLREKDKEKKLPEDRSEMGKARYESAQKAYHLADKLLKQHEAKLEKEANAKREIEREKGRKEMREAFFDANSEKGKNAIQFDKYKAGGEEAYNKLKAEEARKEAEQAKKEPVTDEEKYDKFINECRLKKDAPVVCYQDEKLKIVDEERTKQMQQERVEKLGNMLAAMEFKEQGKPFDADKIKRRSSEIKTIYSLNSLKYPTEKVDGPEKLKNALTFGFRAEALKKEYEQAMYEVGKKKYKNTIEAQTKYQQDITELLERKHPAALSEQSQKILDALNEIKNVNMSDKKLSAMNTYKIGKANKQLIDAINECFAGQAQMDMDAYGPKLALDSLAVLSTYTNCKAAANNILRKVNATVRNKDGSKIDINTDDFTKNYGVKHSKELAQKMSVRPNAKANITVDPQIAAQGNKEVEKVRLP